MLIPRIIPTSSDEGGDYRQIPPGAWVYAEWFLPVGTVFGICGVMLTVMKLSHQHASTNFVISLNSQ